jgi:hypothetical protein
MIRAAIRLTPALIGKMQQHDRSSVSFTEHWHIQQQHTNASLLATANFALSAEFIVDDLEDIDAALTDAALTDAALTGSSCFGSSAGCSGFNGAFSSFGASSPPSYLYGIFK